MRAMILAAGKGTRLGSSSATTPKCLVQVGTQPMVYHVADRLRAAGVKEIVINLHHLKERVRAALQQQPLSGMKVSFSEEPTLLGTGGGLRNARDFFEHESEFLVVNADIFCDFPLLHLVQKRRETNAAGVLLTMARQDSSYLLFDREDRFAGYEVVDKSREVVTSSASELRTRAFCGIQVLTPRVFEFMHDLPDEFSLIEVYLRMAKAGQTLGELDIGSSYWTDMGTPEKLDALRKRITQK